MPYTYLLTHVPSGKRYYGVRLTEKCSPSEDLWKVYFSSSREVKKLIAKTGPNSFKAEVRKVFSDPESARKWEVTVLRRMQVVKRKEWINMNAANAPPTLSGRDNGFYGKKHSKEQLEIFSSKAKIRWEQNYERYCAIHQNKKKPILTEEHRLKMSIMGKANAAKAGFYGRTGADNPMLGKRHSTESRLKMRSTKLGMYDGEKNPMYGKTHSTKARAAVSASRANTCWIHLGNKTKMIKKEELESYILSGWELGRVTSRRRSQN